jgi:hypothetical protein
VVSGVLPGRAEAATSKRSQPMAYGHTVPLYTWVTVP